MRTGRCRLYAAAASRLGRCCGSALPRRSSDESPAEVEEFWAEVRKLPRRQAQSVALYYLYDLSVAEIAQTLECSTGSVKVHLSRGRAALALQFGETDDEVAP